MEKRRETIVVTIRSHYLVFKMLRLTRLISLKDEKGKNKDNLCTCDMKLGCRDAVAAASSIFYLFVYFCKIANEMDCVSRSAPAAVSFE